MYRFHIQCESAAIKNGEKTPAEARELFVLKRPLLFGMILDCLAGITLTPYVVLQLFATRFAAYAGGILVSFIQPHLF